MSDMNTNTDVAWQVVAFVVSAAAAWQIAVAIVERVNTDDPRPAGDVEEVVYDA
jgi:hypothetical protein